MEYIQYDDFKKMDMRIGLIRFVEPVEGTDKLLRFEIDFGDKSLIECDGSCNDLNCHCEGECVCEAGVCKCVLEIPFQKEEYRGRDVRQIVSGIREYFPDYEKLVGKKALYILNLEPRKIRGVMSYGMLMAVDGVDGNPVFLTGDGEVLAGSRVR